MDASITDNDILSLASKILRSQKPWRIQNSDNIYDQLIPTSNLAPWLRDDVFMTLYGVLKPFTLVDIYRCYELWSLAGQMRDVEGDILEVGVWRGGTGGLMAKAIEAIPGKRIFLADTFKGVVKAGEADTHYVGHEHADTSADLVRQLMKALRADNFSILEGVFPEDTQHMAPEKVALLHCDVDVYQSTKDIVEWCLPRLSIGSVIVFDDYGSVSTGGVTRYCDEFRAIPGFHFLYNINGHAVFIKIA